MLCLDDHMLGLDCNSCTTYTLSRLVTIDLSSTGCQWRVPSVYYLWGEITQYLTFVLFTRERRFVDLRTHLKRRRLSSPYHLRVCSDCLCLSVCRCYWHTDTIASRCPTSPHVVYIPQRKRNLVLTVAHKLYRLICWHGKEGTKKDRRCVKSERRKSYESSSIKQHAWKHSVDISTAVW